MKKKLIFIAIVISVIVALAIAVPAIKENTLYHKAIEDTSTLCLDYCNDYIYRYPDGKHINEIIDKRESILYEKVLTDGDESSCDTYIETCPEGKHLEEVYYHKINRMEEIPLTAINTYFQMYPSGKYADSVNNIYNRLWDAEIAKYNSRDKKRESDKAVKYMTEMLQYMKTNHVNTIQVNVNPTLKLKDYTEYSASIRQNLEQDFANETLPLNTSNMVSLKDNFQQGSLKELEEILLEGIKRSMDSMFTAGFIEVSSFEEKQDNYPQLTFNYTIQSQEDSDGYPQLWVYTENSSYIGGYSIPKKYLIGITIRFNTVFTIPNSNVSYTYSERGVPESNISDIDDISDGYKRMTQMCFAQFSNKMSKNMGLKETYFQQY